ncbi:MAG: hypothetical protein LBG15_16120 [Dysgonamonadaceae bacterium]|jgi:hypothetical protein|nr:hypothetical protein [Dysgonamonadaceae bacterium]
MNRLKIFVILSIILIGLIVFVNTIYLIYKNKKNGLELSGKNGEIEFVSGNYNVLKSNLYLMSKLSCTDINKELQLESRNTEHFRLIDILSDSISHLLFIPPMFCSSCNERILQILPDIVESFGDKLKVICHPADVNSVINYCKKKISYSNLFLTKEQIIKEHEQINKMYIISLTSFGQIKSIFLINNADIKAFKDYLEFCLQIKLPKKD